MAQQERSRRTGLGGFINSVAWAIFVLSVICCFLTLYNRDYALIVVALLFLVAGFSLKGLKIIPQPEVWVIERFGTFNRNMAWGIRWMIPFGIEVVRARRSIWEQPFGLFEETGFGIDFRDGAAEFIDPRAFCEISGDNPQDSVYRVRGWLIWLRENLEPVIRGFLNTLTVEEAVDQGMGRGNILDRIHGAPEWRRELSQDTTQQITEIDRQIEEITAGEAGAKEMKTLLEGMKVSLQEQAVLFQRQVRTYERLEEDIEKLEEEARERGIGTIYRVVISDYKLSQEALDARQERLKAEASRRAAVDRAKEEALMRASSIQNTVIGLQQAGYELEEAKKIAVRLEIMETLADKGIWTAGLSEVVERGIPLLNTVASALRGANMLRE
ncbi:SPFH domain-containing protein [Patescibacteria group bacterium]